MYNSQMPPKDSLPNYRQLRRSTLYAFSIASVLMVTIVLPAEFGRDPTGVGTALGLTAMGEIKQSLAKEAALEKTTSADATKSAASTKTLMEAVK